MSVLPLVAIVGWALLLARRARWPIEVAILAIVSGVIVMLFVAGLADALAPAAMALVVGGVLAAAAAAVPALGRTPLVACLTPGLAAFAGLAALHAWRLQDAHFAYWDEFAQWGLQSKVIATTHALVGRDSPVEFRDYPTGAALFHYAAGIFQPYREGQAMAAHGVIALAGLAPLLQRCAWRAWPVAAASLATAYSLFIVFGQSFDSLLIDQLVGAVFAGALASYLLAPEAAPSAPWRAVPGLLVLPLIKEAGFQFALLAAAVIVADCGLRCYAGRRAARLDAAGPPATGRLTAPVLVALAAVVVAPMVTKAAWGVQRERIGARDTFARPAMISTLRRAWSPEATERDRLTLAAFSQGFWRETMVVADGMPSAARLGLAAPATAIRMTVPQGVVGLLLFALPVVLLQRDGAMRWRTGVTAAALAAGFAVYALGHLVAYLAVFSPWEAIHAASLDRYMRTYFLGWSLVSLALLVRAWSDRGRPGLPAALLAASAIVAVVVLPTRGVTFLTRAARPMAPERAALAPALASLRDVVPADRRVYLIFQHTNGFEHWIAKYELVPRRTNLDCWSVGARRGPEDPWTCPIGPADLAARLATYDFVFVARTNADFWPAFGTLFTDPAPQPDGRLYAVRRAADGRIALEPAPAAAR